MEQVCDMGGEQTKNDLLQKEVFGIYPSEPHNPKGLNEAILMYICDGCI